MRLDVEDVGRVGVLAPALHEVPQVILGDVELVFGGQLRLRLVRLGGGARRPLAEPLVPQALRRTRPRPATKTLVTTASPQHLVCTLKYLYMDSIEYIAANYDNYIKAGMQALLS